MLRGITLLGCVGDLVVLFPACLIVVEVKIRREEHLLVAAFPGEYPPGAAFPGEYPPRGGLPRRVPPGAAFPD